MIEPATDLPPRASLSQLNGLLQAYRFSPVTENVSRRLADYLVLLQHWNARMNLTAIRDPELIVSRHFAESIACAQLLPVGICDMLDFGSGAGFPGIPIALCRPEISVTLAESQAKKASFLREAVRRLELDAEVFSHRAETLPKQFDCVTLRAVDRMARAVGSASMLVRDGGWMGVMTTGSLQDSLVRACGAGWTWDNPSSLPGGDSRVFILAKKSAV
jgi:16S rRNA (guanine527-N7)-methyltransferase